MLPSICQFRLDFYVKVNVNLYALSINAEMIIEKAIIPAVKFVKSCTVAIYPVDVTESGDIYKTYLNGSSTSNDQTKATDKRNEYGNYLRTFEKLAS